MNILLENVINQIVASIIAYGFLAWAMLIVLFVLAYFSVQPRR